jgi:toxin ParE1/3/4
VKPVILHSEAEAELRAAAAYYDRQRPGLGRELRLVVEAAVGRIRENPRAFSSYGRSGLRRCIVHRFPYTIFFVELEALIWIAAIAHHKRRPDYWKGRKMQ